jgi:hypothetical protein
LTFRLFIFHGQVPSLAPVRKIEATPTFEHEHEHEHEQERRTLGASYHNYLGLAG